MAVIKTQMAAIGNEPQTCLQPFKRGEVMYAVEYSNGDKAGWHTKECIEHWKETSGPKCIEQSETSDGE